MSRLFLLCAPLALIAATGCGGGSTNLPPVATPTALPLSCSAYTYLPNYVGNSSAPLRLLHWRTFPLRVYFVPDAENSTERRALATQGFNQWVEATNNGATYRVVSNSREADITVQFYTYGGNAGEVLGNTGYDFVEGTDILAAAQIRLGITGNYRNDGITATHEFGHALGIAGHSVTRADLMFSEGNERGCGCLTPADVNTLLTAYCGDFNRNATARLAPLEGKLVHGSID